MFILLAFCVGHALLVSGIPTNGFCTASNGKGSDSACQIKYDGEILSLSSKITAHTFSEENPVNSILFGNARNVEVRDSTQDSEGRPRIVFGESEWDLLLSRYADKEHYNVTGSWSHYFRKLTLRKGLLSRIIRDLAKEETDPNGITSLYDASQIPGHAGFPSYKETLKPMVRYLQKNMTPSRSTSFFLCAFWAEVMEVAEDNSVSEDNHEKCINAIVAWSKILIAHRVYYCFPACTENSKKDKEGKFLWNIDRPWGLSNDYYSAGSSLALAYDVLYSQMEESQRVPVRSAIALLVLGRYSWGDREHLAEDSPSEKQQQYRIFHRLALHHSNLFLTNLAIEGETEFDEYTTHVLLKHNSKGFNEGLHNGFNAMIKAYLSHSINPDGSTFEYGNTYFKVFKEGALAILASHRRESGLLDTPRFRNFIHNAAQMTEPWRFGGLLGHGSARDNSHNTYVALFKYMYPDGELPNMMWRQRFGEYNNHEVCRTQCWQTVHQLAFLGGEQSGDAFSPEELSEEAKEAFPLSFYASRRGLLVARASHKEEHCYIHFDAGADTLLAENDHADRGVLTFSALRQTWLADLPGKEHGESRKHSILHIDGIAQAKKAPSAKMLRVTDNGKIVLAVADLTHAYNIQWMTKSRTKKAPKGRFIVVNGNGIQSGMRRTFKSQERTSPRDFGWRQDDRGENIGSSENAGLHEDEQYGSGESMIWKRALREVDLLHMVRSVGLIRSENGDTGVGIFVDSVDANGGSHLFASHLILHPEVIVLHSSSFCRKTECKVYLQGEDMSFLEVHFSALSSHLGFKVDNLCLDKECTRESQRLVVTSNGLSSEQIWVLLCPHRGEGCEASMSRIESGITLKYEGFRHKLLLHPQDNGILPMGIPPMKPGPILVPFRNYAFDEKLFSSNKETFLHKTVAPLQTVFRVTSTSTESDHQQDEIRSCSFYTQMKTFLAVYDCGGQKDAVQNYLQRKCTFVSESKRTDTCSRSSQQRLWIGKLEIGRIYYVAVYGYPFEGETPRVSVIHLRRRLSTRQFKVFNF